MKLVSTSPDSLVLRARPVMMGIGIAAAMLLFAAIWLAKFFSNDHSDLTALALLFGLFGVVFIVFVRQEVAVFDRPSNTLTLRSVGVLGAREQSRPLAEVIKAVVETSANDGDSKAGPSHRAVLNVSFGPPLPLSVIYRSGSDAKTAVQQINTWLNQKTGQTQKYLKNADPPAPLDSRPPTAYRPIQFPRRQSLPVPWLMPGSPPVSALRPQVPFRIGLGKPAVAPHIGVLI